MPAPFVGTQILPQILYEQGFEDVLDRMQRLCRINAVFVFSQTYYLYGFQMPAIREGTAQGEAGDYARMTKIWVRTNEEYYANTCLRQVRDPNLLYSDVDVLDDLMEPAARRGMQVFPRILEPFNYVDIIPNMPKVLAVDLYGRPIPFTCLNHPDYINWWHSIVEDLIKTHPHVAGFKFGQERGGPMTNLLIDRFAPFCFCDHCRARARAEGINIERAIEGWKAVAEFVEQCNTGDTPPRDGYFLTFVRLLFRYPEVLSWERMWYQSREDHRRQIYGLVKSIDATKRVGWHIVHGMSWDLFFRAQIDYEEVRRYSDWIKPAMYFDCGGPRLRRHFENVFLSKLFRDMDEDTAYRAYLSILGYDPAEEPSLKDIRTNLENLSADYVYREVKRAVAGVKGQVPIYAGVAFDVPNEKVQVSPRQVTQMIRKAFEAGASGIVVPREFHEAKEENLAAVGKVIGELGGTTA